MWFVVTQLGPVWASPTVYFSSSRKVLVLVLPPFLKLQIHLRYLFIVVSPTSCGHDGRKKWMGWTPKCRYDQYWHSSAIWVYFAWNLCCLLYVSTMKQSASCNHPLVDGCSKGRKPHPLHISRWDMSWKNMSNKDGFMSFWAVLAILIYVQVWF